MSWINQKNKSIESLQDDLPEPLTEKGLLSMQECVSEILFGTIMALTFTCTISITESDKASVGEMLKAALSCNIAWGFVDAALYLIMIKNSKDRGFSILNFLLKSKESGKGQLLIAGALPPVIAEVLQPDEIESIRQRLLQSPLTNAKTRLNFRDYKAAAAIFIIVILSTFPVALPFILIEDVQFALRISNLIAIILMFFCGWALGKFGGRKPFVTGILISLLGIVLVITTIALGG